MAGRRFFQISIRTLLILTTLVAIGLAYFNRIRQHVQEQKIAAARIESLGGKATIRLTSRVWLWLRKAAGDEYFQEVVAVDLDKSLVTDADLELVGKLHGMKSLALRGVELHASYPSTFRLPHNPKLQPSQITSAGIQHLGSQKKLERVWLNNTRITDDALATIALWPQLKTLDLHATKVTSRGVQRLEKLERLEELTLDGTKIDDDVVPTLCQMPSLRSLRLHYTAISGEGLLRLREALPACEVRGADLDLSAGIDPDPESMRWKEITRRMWTLGRNGQLKLLILAGTAVSDSHLKDLDRLENTDVIDLRRTKVTKAGVESLQRALPKCKVLR
ncbi:MAG: hypothetical protein ACR2FY_03620 [Pirellulaceae bacterium]